MLDTLLTDIRAVDWTDLDAVTAASDKLLTTLDTQRDVLRRLVDEALVNPDLLRLCEHYDILDKIVLHVAVRAGPSVQSPPACRCRSSGHLGAFVCGQVEIGGSGRIPLRRGSAAGK